MLTVLMDGRAATAKELAYGCEIMPSTATVHLARLVEEGLVTVRAQGRHKYFALASPAVAHCVEALMVIARPVKAIPVQTPDRLRQARLCYDHLAGRLGTQVTAALVKRRVLVDHGHSYTLTAGGRRWLTRLGLEVEPLLQQRRKFAPSCLDWSERQNHLGGALGAALAAHFVAQRWVQRRADSRELAITPKGRAALAEHFRIED